MLVKGDTLVDIQDVAFPTPDPGIAEVLINDALAQVTN